MFIASIIPPKTKLTKRNIEKYFKNDFKVLVLNAIIIMTDKTDNFNIISIKKLMVSAKIISENKPPATEEIRNLIGLNLNDIIAASLLNNK